jgi:AcrR family transcriptional regulator
MKIKDNKLNSRKTQAEERRLQILNVALMVFASKGFSGSSIKDIAQAADISQGLMYHYFASKQDLLDAAVEYHSFLPQLRKILIDAKDKDILEVLNHMGIEFLKLLENKSGLIRIFIREIDSTPIVKITWSNMINEAVTLLNEYLVSQIELGRLRPHKTEVTARSMLGIIFMYHFTSDIFRSSQIKREEFIREVLNNILVGIKIG